jgi:hypothetical protein
LVNETSLYYEARSEKHQIRCFEVYDDVIVKNEVILGAEYFNSMKWILQLRIVGSETPSTREKSYKAVEVLIA